jgi:hypothetical protein
MHAVPRLSRIFVTFIPAMIALCCAGCGRTYYRTSADREVYSLIREKTSGTPWELPAGFTVDADRQSRFFDASDPDRPRLPDPGPALDAYGLPEAAAEPAGAASPASEDAPPVEAASRAGAGGRSVQPIPASYWDAIPRPCLARMLEFESIRSEYRDQYGAEAPPQLRDASPRLTLERIVATASINSREFQAARETLYRAALALTLERYDYAVTFARSGSGVDTAYSYARSGGSVSEGMDIASTLGADTLLAFGGSLLARFTNNVILSFEGPEGWSRDVGSELFASFSQSILQRDIVLEPLIQAERSLVYAARDFARFRKEFFLDLASRYYDLLRRYRSIEIESQNYFSLVRTFEQAQAEVRARVENAPNPVAVDQFEQGMLSGRSSLIAASNDLERDLDQLKLAMGLPTEMALNIDLEELETLTLFDEQEVAAEGVKRWRRRASDSRRVPRPDRAEILNADIYLTERVTRWIGLRQRLGVEPAAAAGLPELLARFRVDQVRVDGQRDRAELDQTRDPEARAPVILIYQRTADVIEALLRLADEQLALAAALGREAPAIAALRRRTEEVEAKRQSLMDQLGEILLDPRQERLPGLLAEARGLLENAEDIVRSLDALNEDTTAGETPEEALARTLEETDRLLALTDQLLGAADLGLPPIEIAELDALGTALVQRLDLMNQRGRLGDEWRGIKLASDDLRSVLNLNASYALRTEDDKPFKFTDDESRAQVALSIDLPLNRKAQRNDYRRQLIAYQAGRRSLMALEDRIKFDVRDGLRELDETRIQYPISVTRAALAAEQVLSVRLQLALGAAGVRGTDLLDALQSSREALIAVANARIGYTVDRARFALDLELLEVDETGFWPAIRDPEYQPQPDRIYPEAAGPTYGDIPSWLWVSAEIRSLVDVPLPGHGSEAAEAGVAAGDPEMAPEKTGRQDVLAVEHPGPGPAPSCAASSDRLPLVF